MNEKYLVYRGSRKNIEWYYDFNGKSQHANYYGGLGLREKNKFLRFMCLIGENEKILNITKFRHEGCRIYAIKIECHRFYCFFTFDARVIITNAYTKKSQKAVAKERINARGYYFERVMKGCYYE